MIPYYPSPAAVTAYRHAPTTTRPTLEQLAEASVISEMLGTSLKRALVLVLTLDRKEISIERKVK